MPVSVPIRRSAVALCLAVALLGVAASPSAASFPATIRLPDGFQPEGIDTTESTTFFVGSIPTGAIWRGDLRTGRGRTLIAGHRGRAAVGLKADEQGRLFVAGGVTGRAFVYDVARRRLLRSYRLGAAGPSLVNDVAITDRGVFFTDSSLGRLYRVPFRRDGSLGAQPDVRTLRLRGDYANVAGSINANGITDTPDGRRLLVVQTATGKLFRVDPGTGRAARVAVTGAALTGGDGLLRNGRTLYVVRGAVNAVSVLRLSADGRTAVAGAPITSPAFDFPSTVAAYGRRLYLPNARFTTPRAPQPTRYDVVRVPAR